MIIQQKQVHQRKELSSESSKLGLRIAAVISVGAGATLPNANSFRYKQPMALTEQDLTDVYNAVNLPEQYRTQAQLGHLLSAVACAFLDTEVTYGHSPMDRQQAEWFGEHAYNSGKFVPTLLGLYEGDDALQVNME